MPPMHTCIHSFNQPYIQVPVHNKPKPFHPMGVQGISHGCKQLAHHEGTLLDQWQAVPQVKFMWEGGQVNSDESDPDCELFC